MSRMVRLRSDAVPQAVLDLTPRGHCIGLVTDEDVLAAGEIVSFWGCQILEGGYAVHQQIGDSLKGIVVYQILPQGWVSVPKHFLWSLCNTIASRACMHLDARDNKRSVVDLLPWMLKPRPVEGKKIAAAPKPDGLHMSSVAMPVAHNSAWPKS